MITGACCSSSFSSLSSTSWSLSKSYCSVVPDSGLGLDLSLSGSRETNLDWFLEHATPMVPAQHLSKEIFAI